MSTPICKPVWWAQGAQDHYAPLRGDLDVDVAIIGAGITGLTLAQRLKDAGCRVAVLEMLEVARGATGHTSGHLTAALDTDYRSLIQNFGMEGAREAARRSMDAIDHIEALSRTLDIDCAFLRVDGWRYTESSSGAADLTLEAHAARQIGLEVEWRESGPLPFMHGAIRFERQARFHPVAWLAGLARSVHGGGSAIFEHTRVTHISEGPTLVLHAEEGTVRARNVVHATHTPTGLILPMQLRIAPYMTYVIGARLDGPPPPDLYWDTADPYHYLRSMTLPDGDTLLLAGGEDHKTGQDPHPDSRFIALEAYLRRRFPVASVDWRWAWEIFKPVDGLPYIGHLGTAPNIYVATGYSGTGLTFGTAAALLAADLLLNGPHVHTSVFHPQRIKAVASSVDFVKENTNVAWRFLRDRLEWSGEQDVSDLAAGEGRVIELDGHKTAVCRAAGGDLYAVSALCPHAGGVVQWNPATETWDCPLHGSRFLPLGGVLAGPACQPLSALSPPVAEERTSGDGIGIAPPDARHPRRTLAARPPPRST